MNNKKEQKQFEKQIENSLPKQNLDEECDISIIRKIVFEEKQNAPDYAIYDIILANIIALAGVFLAAFVPVVSFALPVLFFIYIEVGLGGFVTKKQLGLRAKFEDMFVSLKKYVRLFCVFIIKMVLVAFWLCIFIVPGVICFLDYCFSANILYETDDLDAKSVLILSKELVNGYRATIFLYMAIALASLAVSVSVMFLILMLFDVFFVVTPLFYLVFILLALFLDFLLVALPLVETAIADCYIDAKKNKILRKQA